MLAVLTACTSSPPSPPPSTTAKPVFETEEEALAAVTEAYEAFQSRSTLILTEGGVHPERIDDLASPGLAELEREAYAEVARDELRVTGAPVVESVVVTQWFRMPDSIGVVARAGICVNISSVDVLGPDGASRVSEGRPARSSWVVDFALPEGADTIIVHARDKQRGDCA
ncbi:hypothetical protein KXS11_01635 [Plantibacter flavus]|uniref:hypothetical protein n=1 Tax=Plantibacter flavus TaxID=150123 RepID=UPI003F16B89A